MAGRGGKQATIDQQTKKDLGDAFFLFAYDESGKVSANEVGACIRSVGLNPDEKQLGRIKDQINRQSKGSVSVDDLCKILSQPEYSDLRTSPDEVRDSLRIFDKLGDGMVQTQDFVQALRSLGEPLTEPILQSVLREVDPNGDNQFNIDTFVNVLMNAESRK